VFALSVTDFPFRDRLQDNMTSAHLSSYNHLRGVHMGNRNTHTRACACKRGVCCAPLAHLPMQCSSSKSLSSSNHTPHRTLLPLTCGQVNPILIIYNSNFGEKIAPSTVQHALSWVRGCGGGGGLAFGGPAHLPRPCASRGRARSPPHTQTAPPKPDWRSIVGGVGHPGRF
jgi:hypothetical protein